MSGLAPVENGPGGSSFRPDIEGLRAVAVLLVLAYHARLPLLSGGFVGVDVFFVLSGFLITGLIVREVRETGTISLPAFYARRARRLLPAAAVVILVTVAASAIMLPPLRLPDVALDGAASALYVGNIRFALLATDYLQAELDPSPLLHYWSLGVEEQFYLFWPALLLLVTRLRGAGSLWIGAVVATVGLLSLGLSLALTDTNAPLAFFLLPARAWELALGALVFLGATHLARIPAVLALVAGLAGLAMIVLAGMVINTSTPFPGVAALLPTIGTALVVVAGLQTPLTAPSRLLATAPARWIGRISYSLYLWHWPILVLPVAALGEELSTPARLGLALLTFPIAALSQRFVEEPIRRGRVTGLRTQRTLGLAGATSVAVAVIVLGIGQTGPLAGTALGGTGGPTPELVIPTPTPTSTASVGPSAAAGPSGSPGPSVWPSLPPTAGGRVPDDLIPPLRDARKDQPAIHRDGCHVEAAAVKSGECAYGTLDSKTTVVLFGDSHAAQWFPAFERLAKERAWRLVSFTKASCQAADVSVWSPSLKRLYKECDAWRKDVLERIAAARPAMVVVSNSRIARLMVDEENAVISQTHDEIWAPALRRMLRTLDGLAGEVVLIGDTPNPKTDPPVCLSAHLDDVLACATSAERSTAPVRTAVEAAVAAEVRATFIDPTPWICPTDPCPAVIGRWLVYRDGGHIATAFSRGLAPYLAAELPEIP